MLITSADFCGVSTSSASRICQSVSHFIALLREKYIKFPATDVEKLQTMNGFFDFAKFPRVAAALDCTHVRIQSPGNYF